MGNVLEIENLVTSFQTPRGLLRAVDGVSLTLRETETLCVVGESGSGKSVTALSILRLIEAPGQIESGEILYKGRDVLKMSDGELRKIRGKEIAMIFQEPMTSLNPVFTVGFQIRETIALHHPEMTPTQIRARTIEMFKLVGIPSPETRVDAYPHEMSGGMRQRVMIALALSCDPKVLIADEPTTALDVTIQAQVLELIRDLQRSRGLSLMLITHDLAVVAEVADQVAVMYAGQLVETAPVKTLFDQPAHPYPRGLLKCLPKLGERGRLEAIPGLVPDLRALPPGCRFSDRCTYVKDECRKGPIEVRQVSEAHVNRCVRDL